MKSLALHEKDIIPILEMWKQWPREPGYDYQIVELGLRLVPHYAKLYDAILQQNTYILSPPHSNYKMLYYLNKSTIN